MANNLRASLLEHEGLRLRPYLCTAGKLTIGVGRNLDDRGISEGEALMMLDNDIANAREDVRSILPWVAGLNSCRQDVIVEMAFNLGINGLLKFERTLALVRAGEYGPASDAMLDSRWAKQVGARASVMAARMRTGNWES